MFQYLSVVKLFISDFIDFKNTYILREENLQADVLSKVASANFSNLAKQVLLEVLESLSIDIQAEVATIQQLQVVSWMTPI